MKIQGLLLCIFDKKQKLSSIRVNQKKEYGNKDKKAQMSHRDEQYA